MPVRFVSTNSWRLCEPTCGLCSVAVCSTASTPRIAARHRRPVGDRADDVRVRRRQHVDAHGIGERAHQRLAEVPGAAGDQDPHPLNHYVAWTSRAGGRSGPRRTASRPRTAARTAGATCRRSRPHVLVMPEGDASRPPPRAHRVRAEGAQRPRRLPARDEWLNDPAEATRPQCAAVLLVTAALRERRRRHAHDDRPAARARSRRTRPTRTTRPRGTGTSRPSRGRRTSRCASARGWRSGRASSGARWSTHTRCASTCRASGS